jgi:putative holliday junction resolvase
MAAGTKGCLLGFDFGLKRIGVAVGQRITQTASPLETLSAQNGIPDWTAVKRLVKAWNPEGLVVGMPFNMDDSESYITVKTREFISGLSEQVPLPIYTVDERLSTKAVGYELERLGKKNLKKDDALAACVILESYLAV